MNAEQLQHSKRLAALRSFLITSINHVYEAYRTRKTVATVTVPVKYHSLFGTDDCQKIMDIHLRRCHEGKWNATKSRIKDFKVVMGDNTIQLHYDIMFPTATQLRRERNARKSVSYVTDKSNTNNDHFGLSMSPTQMGFFIGFYM